MNLSQIPIAAILKALSDSNRIAIVEHIGNGELAVSEIVEKTKLSQPLVSHHLKALKQSYVLKVRREGPFIYYSLADLRILDVLNKVNELVKDMDKTWKTSKDRFPFWC